MKKIITILCILSLFIAVVGCSRTTQETSGPTEIKFKDMTAVSTLRKLDGKEVQITGFIAETSPLDGSMIYLMNLPYQNCVYCVPNTNQLMNTMAAFPKQGNTIAFTELPVQITGTLVFEDYTDEMGYAYAYRIVDAQVVEADVDTLSQEVQIFTTLVNRGFATKTNELLNHLNILINADAYGISPDLLQPIASTYMEEIYAMFNGLDESKYTDILDVVDELDLLVKQLNQVLETKDYTALETFGGKDYELFYQIYEWLMQAEL